MEKIEIGPIDLRLIEPVKYIISKDKKGTIKDVEIQHGYAYRAIEKIVKGKKYPDALYFIERICGICTITHTTNFCQGIESILGINIPERAAYIRVVSLELERIQSHLFMLSELMHVINERDLQLRLLISREKILGLLEKLSGNRILHSINTVGGVKKDISPEFSKNIIETLAELEKRITAFTSYINSQKVHSKIRGKGVLTRSSAIALGAVGPVARGSGIDFDIRKNLPYAAYGEIQFSSVVETEGDVEARVKVRLKEVLESIKIIQNALNNIPQGPISTEPLTMRAGYTSSRTEAPRGELLHFIKLSDRGTIENYHLRTPTKANVNTLKYLAIGENIEDFMLLVTSLDPCIACFDSAIIRRW